MTDVSRRTGPIPIDDIPDPDPIALDLWGCIAVQCTLSAVDCKDDAPGPHRCMFMVPRQGYLFFHLKTIKEKFARLVKAEHFIWFSAEVSLGNGTKQTVPVPWQYPTSTVCDILRSMDETTFARSRPIPLTVHFTHDVPEGVPKEIFAGIVPLKADAREQDTYMLYDHLLKQSVALRYGSSAPLAKLREPYPQHSQNIEAGLHGCDGAAFHRGKMALLFVGDLDGKEAHYPVVFHIDGRAHWQRVPASKRTLGQMLQHCVAKFRHMTADDWSAAREEEGVTIQGVSPYLNTPTEVLVDVMGSVDLCLHVVISTKRA